MIKYKIWLETPPMYLQIRNDFTDLETETIHSIEASIIEMVIKKPYDYIKTRRVEE